LPSPEQIEYAEILLQKAEGDCTAVRVLLEREEIADDIVGFHAQQAVEKAMKAVLSLSGVDYPRTHDSGTSPSCFVNLDPRRRRSSTGPTG